MSNSTSSQTDSPVFDEIALPGGEGGGDTGGGGDGGGQDGGRDPFEFFWSTIAQNVNFDIPIDTANGDLFGMWAVVSWYNLPEADFNGLEISATVYLSEDTEIDPNDIVVETYSLSITEYAANATDVDLIGAMDSDEFVTFDFSALYPDLDGDYHLILDFEVEGAQDSNPSNSFVFSNIVSFDGEPVPAFEHTDTEDLFAQAGGRLSFLADLALAAYHLDLEQGHETETPRANDESTAGEAAYDALPRGLELLDADDLPGLALTPSAVEGFAQDGIGNGIYTNENSAALLARSDDALFIAFRGTNDNADILFDGSIGSPDMGDWVNGPDHYDNYNDMFDALEIYLRANPEIEHIYITGHSLGGGMVEAAMRDGRLEINNIRAESVSFASPGFVGTSFSAPEQVMSNFQVSLDFVPWANVQYNMTGDVTQIHHNLAAFPTIDMHSMQLYSDFVTFFEREGITETYQNGIDYDRIVAHGIANNDAAGSYTIGDGDDTIDMEIQVLNAIMLGGDGDDTILAGSGHDYILGGADHDRIYGGNGHDYIAGGTGQDRIWGAAANDTVYGGGNHDTIKGGAGADTLFGDNGNDRIDGGIEGDTLDGGAGNDTLNGGFGGDTIYGRGDDDFIYGGSADDTIYGGANADTLNGGNGFDTIKGGAGADTASGGLKDDTIYGNRGTDTLSGNGGDDALYGNAGNDVLNGNIGDDTIYGHDDDDEIYGGRHDDTLYGGSGDDTIEGGKGSDFIYGNGNDDTIVGGKGTDHMWGGDGADVFVFGSAGETNSSDGTGFADVIYDFDARGDGDVIDLGDIDARTGIIGANRGDQAFTYIGQAIFTGSKGELRIEVTNGSTIIQGDRNGNGNADFEIVLSGQHYLDSSDFIL